LRIALIERKAWLGDLVNRIPSVGAFKLNEAERQRHATEASA